MRCFFFTLAVIVLACGQGRSENSQPLLGVNIAGSYHMFHANKLCYEYEAWFQALNELGVQFVDMNLLIERVFMPANLDREYLAPLSDEAIGARFARVDQQMTAHGLKYLVSVELANWMADFSLDDGVNEFGHDDGTHRWDPRMSWLAPLLPPQRATAPALMGINYDEGEHNQITGNQFVFTDPPESFDKPFFAKVDGMAMEAAWSQLVSACQGLRTGHYQGLLTLTDEQVWGDLFHIFARAGWTVTPKLLKESLSSVTMACAMGAALQYAGEGADLWICCDLNKLNYYPGWAPEALRSALKMGYWLGASALYVENLDYSENDRSPLRHPLADPEGSLLAWSDPTHYRLTNYGQVVKDVYRNYIPAQKRAFTWRDYRPRVAIIRLPDGAWGRPQSHYSFRDRLLGNREHPEDAISAEWLHVWPILTHGVAADGGISLFCDAIYPDGLNKPFFVPLDSVAVFDHTVHGAVLDSVECFVVCGHRLSKETFDDVKKRVAGGATCIMARRLYAPYASAALPGDWLVVDSFNDPAIAAKLQRWVGPPDVARFRFKTQTVEFRPEGGDGDKLSVSVLENRAGSEGGWALYR